MLNATGMQQRRVFTVFCVLAVFGSKSHMAPAAAGGTRCFEPGTGYLYDYESTLLLNEADGPGQGKDVGFHVTGKVRVEVIWQRPGTTHDKVLQLELSSPQLHIKSRKAPAPEGFVSHNSKLEQLKNHPVLLHWANGEVKAIYVSQDEEMSIVNLKKGISSMLQFQLLDQDKHETDASGHCAVTYKSISPDTIHKVKRDCKSEAPLPYINHPEEIWGAYIQSKRNSIITMASGQSELQSVSSEEMHELRVAVREEAGGSVTARQELTLKDRLSGIPVIKEETIDEVVTSIEGNTGQQYSKQTLITSVEPVQCQGGSCPSLNKLVKESREFLQDNYLGTIKSASAFVKLVTAARQAKKEDVAKVLKNSRNRDIMPQIMDLLGTAQTIQAHQAVMNYLQLDNDSYLDLNERYFWALSFSSHPDPEILADVYQIAEKKLDNEKLFETVILSLAAIVKMFMKLPGNENHKLVEMVTSKLTKQLAECQSNAESCRLVYLRALKNLGQEETIPQLLEYAVNGTRKTSVAAMKAIRSFPVSAWTNDVLKTAEKIYYQVGKRYDSSARTLALDILLEANPSFITLMNLLTSLLDQDPVYEVKQYLLQRVQQIGDRDPTFLQTVQSIMKVNNLNNYNALAQRGLSTAFTRSFMKHPSANGSLSTVQEISGGIVKRGLVDVVFQKDHSLQSIFTLGLFAGGLNSFVSSDESTSQPDEPEESATAGMELTIMGVQIRPFVFFSGQGELMGHVWSGTASERTPAFQALGLIQDHLQYIPLELGYIAELSLLGGVSFDLSGQVQLSLWNRNAQSLVEKNAGLSIFGQIKVNTLFVHSQVQFTLATEGKLKLISDIDFYNTIALCLQLKQSDTIVKHNVHKIERIPGSKHRLRKSKYKVIPVPGRTYTLNQKNNEMCNIIFKEY